MVWGIFWGAGRSSLYTRDCEFEAKKQEDSVNSYIKVLDAQLARHYTDNMWFVHNNIPIYTAKKVKAWFEEQRVIVQDWAPYLPNMNFIRYVLRSKSSWRRWIRRS